MDDFKRPEQNDVPNGDPVSTEPVAYEDSETYVTPQGEPTVATPTPAPLETVKKKSHAGRWLLWGLVVLLLAGLCAFAYWQYTEVENAKKENASLQSSLTAARNAQHSDKDDTASTAPKLTAKEQVELVASAYNCILPNATCDKSTFTVQKIQEADGATKPGFAKVLVGEATSGAGYVLYLKSVGELDWVPIWSGQNTPPKEVIDQFAIPVSFTQ